MGAPLCEAALLLPESLPEELLVSALTVVVTGLDALLLLGLLFSARLTEDGCELTPLGPLPEPDEAAGAGVIAARDVACHAGAGCVGVPFAMSLVSG
jgi:hypothetical protein